MKQVILQIDDNLYDMMTDLVANRINEISIEELAESILGVEVSKLHLDLCLCQEFIN